MTIDKDQQKGYASVNGLNLYYENSWARGTVDFASWGLHDR